MTLDEEETADAEEDIESTDEEEGPALHLLDEVMGEAEAEVQEEEVIDYIHKAGKKHGMCFR